MHRTTYIIKTINIFFFFTKKKHQFDILKHQTEILIQKPNLCHERTIYIFPFPSKCPFKLHLILPLCIETRVPIVEVTYDTDTPGR